MLANFPGWPVRYLVMELNVLNLFALNHFLAAARAAAEERARAWAEEVRRRGTVG